MRRTIAPESYMFFFARWNEREREQTDFLSFIDMQKGLRMHATFC